ncbi:hypothetical protein [Bosea sp. PAMC 26642]|uniref:hypothetical protein n=1 Tax=Bosea sp. (strain PAMC 26642) TaxID=1792307 RepID=UPI00076FFC3E|nr:hypothetical protein [Bosea sp. PAMC 26642]AMJ61977.1 hypothetical protein AXW83_18225 [Bosea sp. PAMC 26642]
MLRRLERDATKADLAAVEALLDARTHDEDPVGHLQFARRAEDLNRRLQELEGSPATSGEVGLFFGGRPVAGSYGIQAEFGAKVIAEFQTLVSSTFAAAEGTLGARGPVPQRDRTQLMLTDVARGSFGFILQQAEETQLVDSPMKDVLSRASDLIVRIASPDQEAFENVAESVDARVFASLSSFFRLLDDAGATMRLVEDRREFTLQRSEIELARERTEGVTLDEKEIEQTGTIYVLPQSRRFELHPIGGGDAIKGPIAPDCLNTLTAGGSEILPGILGVIRTVRLRAREIQKHGLDSKKSFTLLSVNSANANLALD